MALTSNSTSAGLRTPDFPTADPGLRRPLDVAGGLRRIVLTDKVLALGPDDPMPLASKIAGGLSLVSWLAVLAAGRMLAFVGGTEDR